MKLLFYSIKVGLSLKIMKNPDSGIDLLAPLRKKKVKKRPKVKLPEEVLKLMKERDDIRRQKAINPTPQIERMLKKNQGKM